MEAEMEAPELFATAVPEEQLQGGRVRALRRLLGPSQCLRSVERPRGVGSLPAIVQGRVQEHGQKGRDFSSCGQWEEAVICYMKAISLDPQRAELYEQRAEAFLQLCDFQSATLNLRKVLVLAPAREQQCLARLALVLDLQGQCLLDQELYNQALEAFTQAAELQPHCRVFSQRSTVCLAALGEFPECLRMLNRELEEDVRNPDMGTLLRQLKDFSAASKDLARARELSALGSPEAQEAQRQLVLTYNDCAVHCYALGRLDEAVKLLGEALRNERTEQGLYANRGDCFFRLGELTYTLADYQQALELSPGNQTVQRRIAAVLREKGQQDLVARRFLQAEACFSMAIEHDPQEALHYLCHAMAKRCLGKVESAREDVAFSLWLSPTDSKILSLARHLFPRKTVRAVLRSLAQQTLDKTLQSPPRLLSEDA